jgi:hypothetical protein
MDDAVLVQVGLLVIGGIAAWVSVTAARAARGDSSTSRYERLSTEYASQNVGEALAHLKDWKLGHDSRGQFEERVGAWAADAASADPTPQAKKLNDERRLIAHLFHRAAKLLAGGALDNHYAKDIRAWAGKTVWREVVRPLDMAYHVAIGTSAVDAKRTIEQIEREFFEKV